MKRLSPSMAVALTALFISLGGVSYGVATGTIDGREIKNNSVSSKDLRNNSVLGKDVRNGSLRGGDVRSNSLGGRQVNESTLDKVPRAGTADNTALLGGLAPGAFARANPAATVDVANGGAERTVLALAGLGRLVTTANGCDTTDPRGLEYAWRNTSGTAQDVWFTVADTDDPGYRPSYGLSQPQDETLFTLNGADPHHVVTTLRIRPVGRPGAAATLDMFATTSGVPNVCRVSAQAVLSG